MGEPNPKPNKYEVTGGADELIIYAKATTLTPYVGTQVATANVAGTNETVSVDSHTRRRYPGDPGSSVASHGRTSTRGGYIPDATLPGRTAWFEKITGTGEDRVVAREQFTFVGTSKALRAFCEENAAQAFTLRLPSGKAVAIADLTP